MNYLSLRIVSVITVIRRFPLFVLLFLLSLIACTQQETIPPTEIPLSTRAPALTSTMAAIRLLPTFTSAPSTPTLTPFPLFTLDPTSIVESSLVRSVFEQEMAWNDLLTWLNVQSTTDKIYIDVFYEVDGRVPGQIELAQQIAVNQMPAALCAVRDAGLNIRPVSLQVQVSSGSSAPNTSSYCFETEALVRMNCNDLTRIEISELVSENVCPLRATWRIISSNEGDPDSTLVATSSQ